VSPMQGKPRLPKSHSHMMTGFWWDVASEWQFRSRHAPCFPETDWRAIDLCKPCALAALPEELLWTFPVTCARDILLTLTTTAENSGP
jgi:hypothetical protein